MEERLEAGAPGGVSEEGMGAAAFTGAGMRMAATTI